MRKDKTMIFRYDNSIEYELNYLCESLGLTKSEVVRHCIYKIYLHEKFGHNDIVRCSFNQFLD